MLSRESLPVGARSDMSEEVLRHAITLRHMANTLNQAEGYDPLGYFSLVDNIDGGFTSYQIAVGEDDHNSQELDRRSLIGRSMSKTALAGAFMHATVTHSRWANPGKEDLETTQHSFLIQGGLFGRMRTTAFDPSRLSLAGDPKKIPNDGRLKRDFWEKVLDLGSDNILVERRSELSDKETREIVRDSFKNFSMMATNLGSSAEEIAKDSQHISFKIGNNLTADVECGTQRVSQSNLQFKIHEGDPVNGKHVMLIVKNEPTEVGVRGVVLPCRDDNQPSHNLEKEDLLMLAGMLAELAEPSERGLILGTSIFGNVVDEAEKIVQPVAGVSKKYIKRVNELLR